MNRLKWLLDQYRVTYEADLRVLYAGRWIFFLVFVVGCLFASVNKLFTHYTTGVAYYAPLLTIIWPFLLYAAFLPWTQTTNPKISFFFKVQCLQYLRLLLVTFFVSQIQFTPFHPVDSYLVAIDNSLGIDTVYLMQWTHQYPAIVATLSTAYEFVTYEAVIVIFTLGALGLSRDNYVYLFALLLSALFTGLIYYFFPTTAPSSVLHSPFFTADQHNTYIKYLQVHHHLMVQSIAGGMVAMPSFHVILVVLCSYVTRKISVIFALLSMINLVIIVSTVLLGWHYFVDVIVAIFIAAICIYWSESLLSSISHNNSSRLIS